MLLFLVIPIAKNLVGQRKEMHGSSTYTHLSCHPSYLVIPVTKTQDRVEGEMIIKKGTMEKLGLEERTIVSFDIPRQDRSKRSIIQRYLHGRSETRNLNGKMKTYRYPGLLDEGGFRLGQSVFLLPPDLASRLILKLRGLKINHRYWDVLVHG